MQALPFGQFQNHPYFLFSIAWMKYLHTCERKGRDSCIPAFKEVADAAI